MPTRPPDQVVARHPDQRPLRCLRATRGGPLPAGMPERTPPTKDVDRSMINRAVLSRNWDSRRQATTYKVAIEGTHKFLLFTEDSLNDLLTQIEAVKGTNDNQHA